MSIDLKAVVNFFVGSFLIRTYVSESPNNAIISSLYAFLSIATVTLPLSARVNTVLGCADKNNRVSDSILVNCLWTSEVKTGEEMIFFRMGMDWLTMSILLSKGILNVLLSIPLMQLKIILFLLFKGSVKFSPSCRKH